MAYDEKLDSRPRFYAVGAIWEGSETSRRNIVLRLVTNRPLANPKASAFATRIAQPVHSLEGHKGRRIAACNALLKL